jgi:glycosyltransferase involved in cell wall biosynthesis
MPTDTAQRGLGTQGGQAKAVPGKARVLVAIPCFNEELQIGSVVLAARTYAPDVLVVDDGSADGTSRIAELAGATVVRHAQNGGKGKAVQTAFRYARDHGYDALVLMDGDGQHDPAEIPLMLEPVLGRNGSSVDVSLGFRFGEATEMPTWRRVGKRVLDYATALGAGTTEVVDSQCGYRAYGRRAIEAFADRLQGQGFGTESEQLILAKELGLKHENVAIHCRYDGLDGSTQGPIRHAMGVLGSVLDFVTRKHPLATVSLPGFVLVGAATLLGIYVISVLNRYHQLATGWALTTAILAILGTTAIFAGLMMHLMARFIDQAASRGRGR